LKGISLSRGSSAKSRPDGSLPFKGKSKKSSRRFPPLQGEGEGGDGVNEREGE